MRRYTLAEATALLPEVIPVLEGLRDAYLEVRAVQAAVSAQARGASGDGHLLADPCDEGGGENHIERLNQRIRQSAATTLDVVPGFLSVGSSVDVTLMSEHTARVEVVCRRNFGGEVPETLAASIAAHVADSTGCKCDVTVEVIPMLTHAGIPRAL